MRIRIVILQVMALSLLVTLGGRMWYLQIRNGDEYTKVASSNRTREIVTPATRGAILDANGKPLADNHTALVVSVSRTKLLQQDDDGKAVLKRLAHVLDMPEKDVRAKVRLCDADTPRPCWKGSPYQPIPVTDKATVRQALQISERAEDFPGVTAEPTAVRAYPAPYNANAAQVLGYLGPVTDKELKASKKSGKDQLQPSDQVGRNGLEAQYDRALRGRPGKDRLKVDNLGRVVGTAGKTKPTPGKSVVTSVDSRIQGLLEKQLHEALKRARTQYDERTHRNFKGDSGAAVVMDVHTGRVVAMASAPSYDPNVWVGGISQKQYAKLTGEDSNLPLLNRAIQGQSAPGSTFKVVSMSAALAAGNPMDGNYSCPKTLKVGGQVMKNDEGESFGSISLPRALEVSCNTVFAKLGYDAWLQDGGTHPKNPKDWFTNRAKAYGLGRETGVDLPSEAAGRIADRKWKQRNWEQNKEAWCKQAKTGKKGAYTTRLARENCKSGNRWRAGDAMNFAIGQGDTMVTPLQMARAYGAVFNGGTLWQPSFGKAVLSADGSKVRKLKPQKTGSLPDDDKTLAYMRKALVGVSKRGTGAGVFGGWPLDEIPVGSKTGTAEVHGKQASSWFATSSKDYAIVMTVSQGGHGSTTSGPSVRKIYDALYGVDKDGNVDKSKALLPRAQTSLPSIQPDGTILKPGETPSEHKKAAREKAKHKKAEQKAESQPDQQAGQDDNATPSDASPDASTDTQASAAGAPQGPVVTHLPTAHAAADQQANSPSGAWGQPAEPPAGRPAPDPGQRSWLTPRERAGGDPEVAALPPNRAAPTQHRRRANGGRRT